MRVAHTHVWLGSMINRLLAQYVAEWVVDKWIVVRIDESLALSR